MADRHDRLRHDKVAQHPFVPRERIQHVLNAPGTSGQAESSTSGARASPQVTPPYSSRRRQDSPFEASLPSSSYRRHDSPMPPPTNDVVVLAPPSTDDVVDPVPPPESEDATDVDP